MIASLPVMVTSEPDARATVHSAAAAAFAIAIAEQVPAYRSVLDTEGVASVADVSIVGNEEEVLPHSCADSPKPASRSSPASCTAAPTPLRAPPHYWREFGCEATDIRSRSLRCVPRNGSRPATRAVPQFQNALACLADHRKFAPDPHLRPPAQRRHTRTESKLQTGHPAAMSALTLPIGRLPTAQRTTRKT